MTGKHARNTHQVRYTPRPERSRKEWPQISARAPRNVTPNHNHRRPMSLKPVSTPPAEDQLVTLDITDLVETIGIAQHRTGPRGPGRGAQSRTGDRIRPI